MIAGFGWSHDLCYDPAPNRDILVSSSPHRDAILTIAGGWR
jgi:hypothetical protein